MQETILVPPDPKRMIEGLRDTGYQFNTAMADIIDNSIAAGASEIDVLLEMDFQGVIRIAVIDNGCGMNRESLIKAMQYGSPPRPDAKSLGKFGLGLKTASTAFCRRLSVISRSTADETFLRATWDLDFVAEQGAWKLQISDPGPDEIAELNTLAKDRAGTEVVWDKVDRLLKVYQNPGGGPARTALDKYVISLREHIAMVYQRFLDTQDGRERNVIIRVNQKPVVAWDPFVSDESEVVADETVTVEIGDKATASFRVRAFVLPRRAEFTSDQAAKRAQLTNNMQGLYIYRENRLIHGPDWLGMFTKEPHGSLLRVEFSFDNQLDEAFHIDIKKSQIILNEDLHQWLNDFLMAPRRAAEDRYRQGQRAVARDLGKDAHDGSNNAIRARESDLAPTGIEVINAQTGEVQITNPQGTYRLKLQIGQAQKPGQVFVQPVESLQDGLLWTPALIDGHRAVQVNTGHPYYHKVYIPNLSSGVTIQGMDSLLWALSVAELHAGNDATKTHFEELRFEVTRILRRLVEDLPEPVELNTGGN